MRRDTSSATAWLLSTQLLLSPRARLQSNAVALALAHQERDTAARMHGENVHAQPIRINPRAVVYLAANRRARALGKQSGTSFVSRSTRERSSFFVERIRPPARHRSLFRTGSPALESRLHATAISRALDTRESGVPRHEATEKLPPSRKIFHRERRTGRAATNDPALSSGRFSSVYVYRVVLKLAGYSLYKQ